MPTGASSTDTSVRVAASRPAPVDGPVRTVARAVADVGHLLRFRLGSVRRPWLAVVGIAVWLLASGAVAVLPAYAPGAGPNGDGLDVLLVLPSAMAGFIVLSAVAAAASGGGRELLARDPATIHPVSPTTDHLGALVLAPLNIAWMIQAWALLGATSYAVGSEYVWGAQPIIALWLVLGTALGQVLAWILEGVRRVPHGISFIRGLNVVVFGVALGLQLAGELASVFDRVPTRYLVVSMVEVTPDRYIPTLVGLALACVLAVALGAVPAHIAAHRVPRDELRVEAGSYAARPLPSSDLVVSVRTDRASVWRAVPMRRGLLVLALGPAAVALLGDLDWSTMTILPGLVVSGGVLLFGVNVWCLDGRGALWRESLPTSPTTAFDARAYVLAEFLLTASFLTVAVASLRAGPPTPSQLAAMLGATLVVTLQVVGAGMRWSTRKPYAADLRSARATPAPPAVMVGYSARLALVTTITGLTFSLFSQAPDPLVPLLLAVPMAAWSTARLLRVRRAWSDPVVRARVVTTVAAA
ncbi:MAG: hypothetical protein CMH83_15980 [Nocardioides sp.]|nr:hypothetical protein [Nocardioides sp.]